MLIYSRIKMYTIISTMLCLLFSCVPFADQNSIESIPTESILQEPTPIESASQTPTLIPEPDIISVLPTPTPTSTLTSNVTVVSGSPILTSSSTPFWHIFSDGVWSKDCLSVTFTRYFVDDNRNIDEETWIYDTVKKTTYKKENLLELDSQILEELEVYSPSLSAMISPSGERLLYTRVSTDRPTPQASNTPFIPQLEIWTAKIDGSDSRKVGEPHAGCHAIGQIIWFDNEEKVVFDCGYEGPSKIFFAHIDGSKFSTLSELTGCKYGVGFGRMALSPDTTKLAFTDSSSMLHVVSLDRENDQIIGYGLMPDWSIDNKHLYYLKTQESFFGDPIGIYQYELDTGLEKEILPSPFFIDGEELEISNSFLSVSPNENAAIIRVDLNGCWLVEW